MDELGKLVKTFADWAEHTQARLAAHEDLLKQMGITDKAIADAIEHHAARIKAASVPDSEGARSLSETLKTGR